ncbi:hypothetical protein [Mesorhizobium sp. LjNodule214]|uniref:hypothetical protein n=1 Tax=Mesorhizobium sp. LjNodule214 TaxID=3342252 RepID=UPI003ECF5419
MDEDLVLARRPVVDGHVMPCLKNIVGHCGTHVPQSDEADVHDGLLSIDAVARRAFLTRADPPDPEAAERPADAPAPKSIAMGGPLECAPPLRGSRRAVLC